MQKGQALIFLLVGILVIAIAGGAYYLGRSSSPKPSPAPITSAPTSQPTPASSPTSSPSDETANWKTYTNKPYRFTLKYPTAWKVKEISPTNIQFTHPNEETDPNGSFPYIGIDISNSDLSISYKENALIDGIKAYRTSAPSGMQGATEGLEFKKDNSRFSIWLLYDDGKARVGVYDQGVYNKSAVATFNQILSTFKFL